MLFQIAASKELYIIKQTKTPKPTFSFPLERSDLEGVCLNHHLEMWLSLLPMNR